MGIFGKKEEVIELNRDPSRDALSYDFHPKISEDDLKRNSIRIVKDIDEYTGMELMENNPRLMTIAITIASEIDRLREAGEETVEFAKKKGMDDEAHLKMIREMVNKSQLAEVAYLVNAYSTNEFTLD